MVENSSTKCGTSLEYQGQWYFIEIKIEKS